MEYWLRSNTECNSVRSRNWNPQQRDVKETSKCTRHKDRRCRELRSLVRPSPPGGPKVSPPSHTRRCIEFLAETAPPLVMSLHLYAFCQLTTISVCCIKSTQAKANYCCKSPVDFSIFGTFTCVCYSYVHYILEVLSLIRFIVVLETDCFYFFQYLKSLEYFLKNTHKKRLNLAY